MARRKRRQFTDEFKRDAARLARESDKGIAAIASDLDLSETVLRRWMREYGMDTKREPQSALTTDERGELRDLRKRVRELEMEREILKKATAFFAKESK
jgi:transposase